MLRFTVPGLQTNTCGARAPQVSSDKPQELPADKRLPAGVVSAIADAANMVREPDEECPTQEDALKASPVWTADGRPVPMLRDHFRGAACFLVCGGPSVTPDVVAALQRRGLLLAALNNVAASVVRPHIWFCCDEVRSFHEAIWSDPAIMKFAKLKYLGRAHKWAGGNHNTNVSIRRWDGESFKLTGEEPRMFANVYGYLHTKGWSPEEFLRWPVPSWGINRDDAQAEGGRARFLSIMLPSLWLLYWLGVRRLYLVGCDFRMEPDKPYAFDEWGNAASNNALYKWLNRRFAEWRPFAEQAGYQIVNATGDGTDSGGGGLTAFRRMPLDKAIAEALEVFKFPARIVTAGNYALAPKKPKG